MHSSNLVDADMSTCRLRIPSSTGDFWASLSLTVLRQQRNPGTGGSISRSPAGIQRSIIWALLKCTFAAAANHESSPKEASGRFRGSSPTQLLGVAESKLETMVLTSQRPGTLSIYRLRIPCGPNKLLASGFRQCGLSLRAHSRPEAAPFSSWSRSAWLCFRSWSCELAPTSHSARSS